MGQPDNPLNIVQDLESTYRADNSALVVSRGRVGVLASTEPRDCYLAAGNRLGKVWLSSMPNRHRRLQPAIEIDTNYVYGTEYHAPGNPTVRAQAEGVLSLRLTRARHT